MHPTNLLFATGKSLYPMGEGGGETVAHDLLFGLCKEGIHCTAFGTFNIGDVQKLNYILRGLEKDLNLVSKNRQMLNFSGEEITYPVEMLCSYHIDYDSHLSINDTLVRSLSRYMDAAKPDVVLTQSEGSDSILAETVKRKIFPIVYIHVLAALQIIPEPHQLPLILVNSKFIQNRIMEQNGIQCELLYPAINLDQYRIDDNSHQYITMINPVVPKGIVTFLNVAASLPDREFLVVEGWGTSEKVLNIIKQLPNITYLPKQVDMRRIFEKTHLLLVPSIWEEPFGRISVEAQVSGIPVIASTIGGIPEAVGRGGILIDDFENEKRWLEAIQAVEEGYQEFSQLAAINAQRFDLKKTIKHFLHILSKY